MYHFTANPRPYNTGNVVELAGAIARCWLVTSVCAALKGVKKASNFAATLRGIFEPEKKYNLGTKVVTGNEIIACAEKWEMENPNAQCQVIVEGRHRLAAAAIAKLMLGAKDDPEILEVNEDVAQRITLEGNAANDFVTRLANKEKLAEVIGLMKSKVYTKEADLPFKRGTAQKLWAQAELVVLHGIAMEDALKLDKEAARKAGKSANVTGAVQVAVAEKAGNKDKVMSGSKIRDLLELAKTNDPEGKKDTTKLLDAIINDLLLDAKQIIVGIVVPEANAEPAKAKKVKAA